MFNHGLEWTHGEIHKKAFPENEKVILLLYMRLNNKITINIYDFLYLAYGEIVFRTIYFLKQISSHGFRPIDLHKLFLANGLRPLYLSHASI